MKAGDFSITAPGKIVPTAIGDGVSFHPDDLPPRSFQADFALMNQLSEADVALATLEGHARTLHDPKILLRPFLRKEAIDSSRIEGTQTTYSELIFFEAANAAVQRAADPDTQVTANYLAALESGLDSEKELPVSRSLMSEVRERIRRAYSVRQSPPVKL